MVVVLSLKSCDSAGNSGTTPNIKEVMIGRCWQYQSVSSQNKKDVLNVAVNCTDLWEAFHDAFAYKDPCNIGKADYQKFFQMVNNTRRIENVSLITI